MPDVTSWCGAHALLLLPVTLPLLPVTKQSRGGQPLPRTSSSSDEMMTTESVRGRRAGREGLGIKDEVVVVAAAAAEEEEEEEEEE